MGKLEASIMEGLVCLSEANPDADRCMFVFPLNGMSINPHLFESNCDVSEHGPVALVCGLPECKAAA